MDLNVASFLLSWYFYGFSLRLMLSLMMFYPLRSLIQNVFLIARVEGFLWFYPGVHAYTVPYFDTNDFYFSGHIGSTFLLVLEYRALGWKWMMAFGLFVMASEWVLLMVVRCHYIIDFVSGMVVAQFLHRCGEKVAFGFDVWLLGLPKQKR